MSTEGQSLWEVIIALSIAGLIALGLARMTASSLKSARFSQDQSFAETLAQKKITQIIGEKNADPTTFWQNVAVCAIPSGCEHSEEQSEDQDHCIVARIKDASASLPTTTPNYSEAKMAQIIVDVLWNRKGSEIECIVANYEHASHYETYVTN